MSKIKDTKNFQHTWSILCHGSSIDKDSNNISLFNIIEELNISKKGFSLIPIKSPQSIFVPLPLRLVSMWKNPHAPKIATSDVQVDFRNPQGKLLNKMIYKISSTKSRMRSLSHLKGFGVSANMSGEYTFDIKIKKGIKKKAYQKVGEVSIQINIK